MAMVLLFPAIISIPSADKILSVIEKARRLVGGNRRIRFSSGNTAQKQCCQKYDNMIVSRREHTSSFSVASTPTTTALCSMKFTTKVATSSHAFTFTESLRLSRMANILLICFSIEASSKWALVMVMNRLLSIL